MNLPAPFRSHLVVPSELVKERGGILCVMSGQNREGVWDVPQTLRVLAIMGSVELDLREARIGDGDTVIEISAWFASVEITIPPGVQVECDGTAMAGEFTFKPDSTVPVMPGAPRLIIRGGAWFGSVEIDVRYAGEGVRQARRRIKSST